MGHSIDAAHDPSVADYRAASPRFAQGGIRLTIAIASARDKPVLLSLEPQQN